MCLNLDGRNTHSVPSFTQKSTVKLHKGDRKNEEENNKSSGNPNRAKLTTSKFTTNSYII